jgi:hypothetical protein
LRIVLRELDASYGVFSPVTFAAVYFHRLRWLNLPGALLVLLLQRTPVLRLVVAVEERIVASPAGALLRSAAVALGSLGALHSMAGATTMQVQQNSTVFVRFGDPPRLDSPIPATVGTAIAPIFVFVTGAPVPAGSYQIMNLPPGLSAAGANANGLVSPASTLFITGTPTTAGTYTTLIRAWELAGGPATNSPLMAFPENGPVAVTFIITASANAPPAITSHPVGQIVAPGGSATFTVSATGSPLPAYQWQRNGVPITGATNVSLGLTNVQATDAGDYRVVVTNEAGSVTSNPATLSVVSAGSAARLSNLSVRTTMVASQTLIVGVTAGGGAHQVLVRAAGPALGALGVPNTMSDPRIDGASATLNDNWDASLGTVFSSVGAFGFTVGSRDAALVQNLDGGTSFLIRGTGGGAMIVESYDLGAGEQRLTNVSARNRAGTGDDILIAGITIAGSGAKPLLIRAVGPKLGSFGVTGFLVDPKLEVFNGTTLVGQNDSWDASLAATFTAVGAFALDAGSRDAALLTSLPPGSYTVQVRGSDGGVGEALVEIYEVP